ncbi:tyrosine-type recombinase/integrase [Foetidibacter luteolus]|uniref:tyrosine-type recombinase/integrase n=1 Tax=Foetidibacter luteolus TaxID=2608880 RepID=UPI00129A4CDA|nr:tyrosine-type recombinase/integrase [Foetidibacter luteolus]
MHTERYPQVQAFISYLSFEKRFSQNTVIAYQTDLEQFFSFLISQFDGPGVNKITPGIIKSWLAELKGDDNTAKTINRKISTLKSFFRFMTRQGEIAQTPMATVVAPKISKRLPEFVSEDEIKTLFEYVEFPDNWQGRTDRLVLLLFYSTGMRLSELVNLKETQVDGSYNHLKVLGKGNKERIIPLQKELLQQLQQYIEDKKAIAPGEGRVFVTEKGRPLYPKYVYNLVTKWLGEVTTRQKKSPHILRHTFATHLTNNGADLNAIKELLGHSSLAATQVYTHNSIEKLKDAYKKAHPKA